MTTAVMLGIALINSHSSLTRTVALAWIPPTLWPADACKHAHVRAHDAHDGSRRLLLHRVVILHWNVSGQSQGHGRKG
jgi:hypothetical protein